MSDGTKHDSGKPKLSLLPMHPLTEIARVMDFGAAKYGKLNYRKGMAWSRVIDAALRHLHAFNEGIDLDSESGISHVAHAATNLVFLLQFIKDHPEKDDRKEEPDPAIYERELMHKRVQELSTEEQVSLEERMEAEQAELRKLFGEFMYPDSKGVYWKPARDIP